MQGNTAKQQSLLDTNRLVVSIRDLPTLPVVLAEILQAANNPSASAMDLQLVISKDPALAAKLLKLANSAMFGFSRRIESIQQAVVAIGFRRIRSIASAAAVAPVFKSSTTGMIDGPMLWSHSVACAMWTQQIAGKVKYPQTDQVFTAGLLHDVGILVLNQYVHKEYGDVLLLVRDEEIPLCEAELRVLGTTHERVGAALSAKWMLPASLTQMISYHHAEPEPVDPAAQILALADHLATASGMSEIAGQPVAPEPEFVRRALGLTLTDMDELRTKEEEIRNNVALFHDD